MLKSIKVNFDIIEMLQFYWESIASRDKVVDSYFAEVAAKPAMKSVYNEEFTNESVRKVLSAIMNRERVNNPTKQESKFWNNNMWMLEDLDNMRNMLQPIKVLNLDELKEEVKDSKYEELIIDVVPGTDFIYKVDENVITLNFFRIIADFMNPEILKIDGVPLRESIKAKAVEVISK